MAIANYGRGGARAGAGRKRLADKVKKINLAMSEEDFIQLKQAAESENTNISALLRGMIAAYIKR